MSAATHLASVGQPARAMELLAGDLTELSDVSEEVVRAALARCWLGTTVGDTEQALRDIELARQLTSDQDEAMWARICAGQAMALGTSSRWDEAAGPARTALELGTTSGDVRTVGIAHGILGIQAVLEGRLTDALGHDQTAFAIAHKLAEPEDLALAGVVLTDIHWRLGDPDRALHAGAVIRREVGRLMLGRHWLEDIMDGNVVLALYEAGRWDEAVAWVSDPTEPSELGFFQAVLLLVHLARGDRAAAEELEAEATSLSERDQPQFLSLYGEARARLLLHRGRPEKALELVLSTAETMSETLSAADAAGLLLTGAEAASAAAAPDRLEQLVALLGRSTKGRTGAAVTAVGDGERSRAGGVLDPGPWQVAAREWARLGRPHDEAWAHLRAAEAVLAAGRALPPGVPRPNISSPRVASPRISARCLCSRRSTSLHDSPASTPDGARPQPTQTRCRRPV